MFTGIVKGLGEVTRVEKKEHALTLVVDLGDLSQELERGASVSVGGVCLTAVVIDGAQVTFDVIGETLAKTAIGELKQGDKVNIERSVRMGEEIGGHLVAGHVASTVTISAIDARLNNWIVTLQGDKELSPYLFPKGFIALDGCSLTVVDVGPEQFTVHLIPETLARTTFGFKRVGDRVNLEIDPVTRAIVDTVKRLSPQL